MEQLHGVVDNGDSGGGVCDVLDELVCAVVGVSDNTQQGSHDHMNYRDVRVANDDTSEDDAASGSDETSSDSSSSFSSSPVVTDIDSCDDDGIETELPVQKPAEPTTKMSKPEPQQPALGLSLVTYSGSDSSDSDDNESDAAGNTGRVTVIPQQKKSPGATKSRKEVGGRLTSSGYKAWNAKISKAGKPGTTIKVPGELDIDDLPKLEKLEISVSDGVKLEVVGKVLSIVRQQVIIESAPELAALDEDTVLFIDRNTPLGKIFEVFGPVHRPLYIVRFNNSAEVDALGLYPSQPILYAPTYMDITNYVLVSVLKGTKGSDASWKADVEVPVAFQDYSDDEEERRARGKHKLIPPADNDNPAAEVSSGDEYHRGSARSGRGYSGRGNEHRGRGSEHRGRGSEHRGRGSEHRGRGSEHRGRVHHDRGGSGVFRGGRGRHRGRGGEHSGHGDRFVFGQHNIQQHQQHIPHTTTNATTAPYQPNIIPSNTRDSMPSTPLLSVPPLNNRMPLLHPPVMPTSSTRPIVHMPPPINARIPRPVVVPPANVNIPPPNFSVPPPNLPPVPHTSVAPPTNFRVPSQTGSIPPQPPANLGIPPRNIGIPRPNVGMPPRNIGIPRPNVGMPPPNMGIPPPNTSILPLNTSIPPLMGIPPPNMGIPPPNTSMPPQNVCMPPSSVRMPPPSIGIPPPPPNSSNMPLQPPRNMPPRFPVPPSVVTDNGQQQPKPPGED